MSPRPRTLEVMLDVLRSMAVLAAVARHHSFAAAARELGVTRAAVSHQVRRLEDELGVPLVHRTTRSLALTPAGQLFAERCQRMVDEAQLGLSGLELLRREPRGRVRLTSSHHFGQHRVVPALVEFRRRYPAIELDVRLTDANVDLVAQGIDLAVRAGPLRDSTLKARRLLHEPTLLCAAPRYLERHGTPEEVSALAEHAFVLYPASMKTLVLECDGEHEEVRMGGSIRTNSAAARLAFVLAGEGMARLPAYDARPALSAGQLVRVLPQWSCASLSIYLVQAKRVSASARRLADYLVESLRS